uniref:Uncharacterized protein n=1 Tax=Plectus sambesii TaxID=2011161 RepID=A0A914XQ80_9BILA
MRLNHRRSMRRAACIGARGSDRLVTDDVKGRAEMRTNCPDKATAPTHPVRAPRDHRRRPFIPHSLRKNYRLATRSHVNRPAIHHDIGREGIDRFRRRRRVE